MSETVSVELTNEQREMLLHGLRFVRSNLMLDIHDPTPELDQDRENKLREIASLVEQLQRAAVQESSNVA